MMLEVLYFFCTVRSFQIGIRLSHLTTMATFHRHEEPSLSFRSAETLTPNSLAILVALRRQQNARMVNFCWTQYLGLSPSQDWLAAGFTAIADTSSRTEADNLLVQSSATWFSEDLDVVLEHRYCLADRKSVV